MSDEVAMRKLGYTGASHISLCPYVPRLLLSLYSPADHGFEREIAERIRTWKQTQASPHRTSTTKAN
jgi:hypothetical protein